MNPILKRFQFGPRVVHETPEGGEIWQRFYCEPYSAYPLVKSWLLGGIDNTTNPPTRVMPIRDPYEPNYYVQDVRVDQIHDDAISGSPGTGYSPNGAAGDWIDASTCLTRLPRSLPVPRPDGPNYFNESLLASHNPDENRPEPMRDKNSNVEFTAGAFVTAILRPVRSAYSVDYNTFEGTPETADEVFLFDAIDPHFEPYSLAVSIAKSLKIIQTNAVVWYSSTGNASSLVESYEHVTIRRAMCPRVPYETIAKLANKINQGQNWSPRVNGKKLSLPNLPLIAGDNAFPSGTLRFVNADVTERMVSSIWYKGQANAPPTKNAQTQSINQGPTNFNVNDTIAAPRPQTWFDITYHFEWRTQWDNYLNENGDHHTGWIDWNHVLAEPGWGVRGYSYLNYYPVGWSPDPAIDRFFTDNYRPLYLNAWTRGLATIAGRTAGFDALFDLSAP